MAQAGGSLEVELELPDPGYTRFGESIAHAGDLNLDGIPDILVGAPRADSPTRTRTGAVRAYSGTDGQLLFEWFGETKEGRFGESVASAGDFDGDGFPDILVGAPKEESFTPPRNAGAVWIYSGQNGALLQRLNGGEDGDRFGKAIAGGSDFNQDGVLDIVIGAPGKFIDGLGPVGSVSVFSGSDGALLHEWYGRFNGDRFGNTLAIAGDVDADGVDDIIIGVPTATPNLAVEAGSAFVYSGRDGTLIHQWHGSKFLDNLGRSVAGAGDIDQDGHADLIVGIPGKDTADEYSVGQVNVYSGRDGSIVYSWQGLSRTEFLGTSVASVGDVNGDAIPDVLYCGQVDRISGRDDGKWLLRSGADGHLLKTRTMDAAVRFKGLIAASLPSYLPSGRGSFLISAPRDWNTTGLVTLFHFDSFLTTNQTEVSASQGAVLQFNLDFPDEAAHFDYKILMSASGFGPSNHGVNIPLTQDFYTWSTYLGNYPFPNAGEMQGSLDHEARASVNLQIAPGLPASLIGSQFQLAAIAMPGTVQAHYSSSAHSLTITP